MIAGILSFSEQGYKLSEKVAKVLQNEGIEVSAQRCPRGDFRELCAEFFASTSLFIFIGSCGLAVRGIAPYVQRKDEDPAVLVVDEKANYVISLLSGHLGGANMWTRFLATNLNAEPIITTATDVNGLFAVDDWTRAQGLKIADVNRIVDVSSQILAGELVRFWSTFERITPFPEGVIESASEEEAEIVLSDVANVSEKALSIVPPVNSLGIGCRKGTPYTTIQEAISTFLSKVNVHEKSVFRIASIDLKAHELGLLKFSELTEIPFETFSAQELLQVSGEFTKSEFVRDITGVDCVCERAALAGLKEAVLTQKKTVIKSVTLALAKVPYRINFS